MATPPSTNGNGGIFTSQHAKPERSLPIVPLAIAGAAVLILVAALAFFTRGNARHAINQVLPPDPYAASLAISDTKMSQSSNISGGTYTYLDGHIANNGSRTVTGITVQVIFNSDSRLPPQSVPLTPQSGGVSLAPPPQQDQTAAAAPPPPQIETTPIFLIRSREPYIDTQPVAAAPLAPGAAADFRLTFESISPTWNQQMPEVRIVETTTK